MTSNDQENIERKLNHVISSGDNIINMYRHITCTERVSLMLAMTANVKQVTANLQNVSALLRKNLLDPFRIKYTDYARRIENLLKIWQEELKGAPVFHNLDTQRRPITNPSEIIMKEDTDYDMAIDTYYEEEEIDFKKIRFGLLRYAPALCAEIEKRLDQISRILRGIVDDDSKLKSDTERQDKRLKELENLYEEEMWVEDLDRLKTNVELFIETRQGCRDKYTYELFLKRLEWEATDPHDIKILAQLNEWYLAGQRPAAFIVENRDKLNIEDIARHFCFVRCRHLILRKIESFDLLQPVEEGYKDLFVNRASMELAFLLAPTIGIYVDFRHNYQYAALQMAMQDLGVIYNDRSNGVQMKDYINKAYLSEDEQIKDQTTLTQWTGKLLGSMFGTMDEHHLKGNFSLKDFEKMKDYYWLCLSIINKIVQLDLEELQFAPYLYKEHEKAPSINDYKNREGQSIMERLSVIKSVIRGEDLLE